MQQDEATASLDLTVVRFSIVEAAVEYIISRQ